MKGKWSSYLLAVVVMALTLAGCKGCNEGEDPEQNSRVIDPNAEVHKPDSTSMGIPITPEQRAELEEKLDNYLSAFEEGRFEDLIELSHPYMMVNDDEKRLAIEEMKEFWARGVRNVYNSYELKFVSPLHDIDSMYVGLIKWDIDGELQFLDQFDGNIKNYKVQLSNTYHHCRVELDEENRKYTMKGEQHAFVFTPKDHPDFLFINTSMIQSPRINVMIDIETLNDLRQYGY